MNKRAIKCGNPSAKKREYAEDFIKHIQELHLSFSIFISVFRRCFTWCTIFFAPCSNGFSFVFTTWFFFLFSHIFFVPMFFFNKIKHLKHDYDFSSPSEPPWDVIREHSVEKFVQWQNFDFYPFLLSLFLSRTCFCVTFCCIYLDNEIHRQQQSRETIKKNLIKISLVQKE